MTFQKLVRQTPCLASHLHRGLRALAPAHRTMIECDPPHRLRGSVSLDPILAANQPFGRSWDYLIGWSLRAHVDGVAFAEVHPANHRHVEEIIQKKQSTQAWMEREAWMLLDLAAATGRATEQPVFHWIATDSGVAITGSSPQARRLRQAGISGPKRRLVLP